MSKQSEAKLEQGYVDKAIPKTCVNCAEFHSEVVLPKWLTDRNEWAKSHGLPEKYLAQDYARESNLRCKMGGFVVKKLATCNKFTTKVTP